MKKNFNSNYLNEKHFQKLSIKQIKKLGLSNNKARTIKEISELYINKNFVDLTQLSDIDLKNNLT